MLRSHRTKFLFKVFLLCNIIFVVVCTKNNKKNANKIGKKITDYNDVDVEKLLDQWNVSEMFNSNFAYLVKNLILSIISYTTKKETFFYLKNLTFYT